MPRKKLPQLKYVQVLDQLASGKTTKQIVKTIRVSSRTVWELANELPLWQAARDAARKLTH